MLLGIDAWHGYGAIDWARANAAGVRFAVLKCTQGNDGKDPRFDQYAEGCRNAGIPAAPYLFAYPLPSVPGKESRSPENQARAFYGHAKGLGTQAGDLPPVIDLEWPPHFEREASTSKILDRWTQWAVTAEFICEWSLACLAEIERLFGRTPIIYTYPHWWQSLGEHGKDPAFAKYPLWIANYTHGKDWMPPDTAKPIVPAPWQDWTIWQFSADGSPVRIPGVPACPLDRNVIREADLATLTGKRAGGPAHTTEYAVKEDCVRRP
jgi:lysozyme